MDFEDWEPYYERILKDFDFSREEDERAAEILDQTLAGRRIDPKEIAAELAGKAVCVAGNASSLAAELGRLTKVVVAADEATSVLLAHGRLPQVIVTDLDGEVMDQVAANRRGAIAVVHAHGDNIPAIEKWGREFEGRTLATTQARPSARVFNFGGFTDGDRAAFLADAMGARSIRLVGFDFEHPNPKDEPIGVKKRKLDWAFVLLQTLNSVRQD